jgi:hypothetical protein
MSTSSRESINDWDEEGVSAWLSEIGLPQYQEKIKGATLSGLHPSIRRSISIAAHSISGDILAVLDHEGLKEIGIHSVGQRLSILKEVYHLKVAQGIPIEASDYVPPCNYTSLSLILVLSLTPPSRGRRDSRPLIGTRLGNFNGPTQVPSQSLAALRLTYRDRLLDERLRLLEEENKRLSDSLQLCLAELKNNANGTNKVGLRAFRQAVERGADAYLHIAFSTSARDEFAKTAFF